MVEVGAAPAGPRGPAADRVEALPLRLRVDGTGDLPSVVASGELDAGTAGSLRDALLRVAVPGRLVVADLRGVTFLDARGMGPLAAARAAGARLRVLASATLVGRVLEACGFDPDVDAGPAGLVPLHIGQ